MGRLTNKIRAAVPALQWLRISFGQYAEDLLLAQMSPQDRGFYVDVGAYQPRSGSNTYKLYRRGWSGVTIEPNPDVASAFKKIRPRDTHLNIGISDVASELTYHKCARANVNSFDPTWAAQMGLVVLDRIPIRCLTLTDVLDRECPDRHIDLLSVDCEGNDMQVLESLDWTRYRPTVVILEDFDQFRNGALAPEASPMRAFMLERHYALASQAVFSFLYVDSFAFDRTDRDEGFQLDRTQLNALKAREEAPNSLPVSAAS